jgi:hypothetical protein
VILYIQKPKGYGKKRYMTKVIDSFPESVNLATNPWQMNPWINPFIMELIGKGIAILKIQKKREREEDHVL